MLNFQKFKCTHKMVSTIIDLDKSGYFSNNVDKKEMNQLKQNLFMLKRDCMDVKLFNQINICICK